MDSVEPGEAGSSKTGTRGRGFRPRRVLGIGCLVVCLALCAAIGGIAAALQAGPVEIGLPNNNLLKQQYRDLQRRYQRLFLDYKRTQRNGAAAG